MAGFTPGPWMAEPCGCENSNCHLVTSPVEQICGRVTGDNARLIAAAPDLYEALHDCPLPDSSKDASDFYRRFYAWYEGQRAAARAALTDGGEG